MPVISVDIESNRPVIAANLEELRYLVFHGMKGDTGDSAYELAVELGFEGTEAEWLASLRGTDGTDGADGKNYGIVVDGSVDNILELKSVEAGAALPDGILFDNPANLLNFPDRETVYNGVTFRSCSDRPRIYLNGTATARTIVNLDNGETVSTSSEAKTAWGGNTLDWLAVGKRYKLVWRCVSGTYRYSSGSNPAITVRDSNAGVILSNARGAVLLSNPASFTQLYFYNNTVFNECWFEASVIETDTDEQLEQSSASMMLNANIALPQVSSLIDELSYTIPAEVTATGSFTDANGYAEGGCTDGNNTLYYVRHKGDTTTPIFVKATASGEVQATSSPSGVQFVHSNGMACNPTTGEVLVIPLDTSGNNAVHFLSAENLSYIRTINFGDSLREYAPDMTYFTAAAWDSTKQLYVFLLAGNSGYTNPVDATEQKRLRGFAFYDAEFNFVKCIRFDRRLTIPGYNDFDVTDTTFGGVYTDADYIYTTVHKSSGDVVAVFDWDGLMVGTFSAAFGHELEWMGRLGDGSWVFGYGSTVNNVTHVDVYKAETSAWRQVLKSTVRSQFKPHTTVKLEAQASNALQITKQPEDAYGYVGGTAVFSVGAIGNTLTYQWQYSTDNGSTWTNSNNTTETATCAITAARDGRQYRCVITDSNSITVTSNPAVLNVVNAASSVASGDKAPVSSGAVYTALQGKQDTLTVDSTPTQGHSNPVTSDGVYTALQGKQNTLTVGTGITIDSNNVISASGGGVGWRQLTASEFGFTTSSGQSTNVGSISSEAYYCAALGIVRFSLTITTSGAIEGSQSDPKEQRIAFDTNLHYKPYFMSGSTVAVGVLAVPFQAQGVSNRLQNAHIARANASSNDPYISVVTVASISSGSSRSFSGFYYTEDIPSS